MNILQMIRLLPQSWWESLKLFAPSNFIPLLLVTLKSWLRNYQIIAKNWALVIILVYIAMTSYFFAKFPSGILVNMAVMVVIYTIAARPAVDNKKEVNYAWKMLVQGLMWLYILGSFALLIGPLYSSDFTLHSIIASILWLLNFYALCLYLYLKYRNPFIDIINFILILFVVAFSFLSNINPISLSIFYFLALMLVLLLERIINTLKYKNSKKNFPKLVIFALLFLFIISFNYILIFSKYNYINILVTFLRNFYYAILRYIVMILNCIGSLYITHKSLLVGAYFLSPFLIFSLLFVLDSQPKLLEKLKAFIRAFTMLLYNYPFCLIIFIISWFILYGTDTLISYYNIGNIGTHLIVLLVLIVIIPFYYSLLTNFYFKRLHDQFMLYYKTE